MNLFKRQLGIIFVLTVLIGVFGLTLTTKATDSILRGEAWWPSQKSYLYFNCLDDVVGDRLDVLHNMCGIPYFSYNNAYCGTGSFAFHFYAPPCSWSQHRVIINQDGDFSGQAWNYAQGFVSFNGTTTPDNYSFNTNCPKPSSCTSATDCLACYNDQTQKVYGWARTENGTWINLNPATSSPTQIKNWNPSVLTSPFSSYLNPGDFIGYASDSSSDYLSFNCLNNDPNTSCNSYKVYISNLQVGHMSAPNWTASDACSNSALEAQLDWSLKSGSTRPNPNWPIDYQTGFRIIINTKNSTSSPVFDSGVVNSSATQYIVNKNLNYNTDYYWFLKLRDNKGNWTQWYEFGAMDGHDGLTDTITTDAAGNPMGHTYTNPDVKTFSTYKHAFPEPYFDWSPSKIFVGSTTTVWSTSNCYQNNCHYLWTVNGDPDARFYDNDQGSGTATSSASSTYVIFHYATSTSLNLQVSDGDGYSCSTSTDFNVNYVLPIWREIKAQ